MDKYTVRKIVTTLWNRLEEIPSWRSQTASQHCAYKYRRIYIDNCTVPIYNNFNNIICYLENYEQYTGLPRKMYVLLHGETTNKGKYFSELEPDIQAYIYNCIKDFTLNFDDSAGTKCISFEENSIWFD